MDVERFTELSEFSSCLHGHKYVFPVAVWIFELGSNAPPITQPEIRKGLVHAESNRIFEALERLTRIGAMTELPPAGKPPRRFFERRESPYWDFIERQRRAVGDIGR